MARSGSLGMPPWPSNMKSERNSIGTDQRTAFDEPIGNPVPAAIERVDALTIAALRKS